MSDTNYVQARAFHAMAKVAFEVNLSVVESFGLPVTIGDFDSLAEQEQLGLVQAVIHYLANPTSTPAESHDHWRSLLVEAGGTIPEHLNFTYAELPQLQRTKDEVFRGLIVALSPLYELFYTQALMEQEANGVNIDDEVMRQITLAAEPEPTPAVQS